MLLFRDRHVAPILNGEKTQTRRSWARWKANVGSLHWAATKLYRPEARFARLAILERWEERLMDISEADAKAEGGYTVDRYIQLYMEITPAADPEDVLKCLRFCVVPRNTGKVRIVREGEPLGLDTSIPYATMLYDPGRQVA